MSINYEYTIIEKVDLSDDDWNEIVKGMPEITFTREEFCLLRAQTEYGVLKIYCHRDIAKQPEMVKSVVEEQITRKANENITKQDVPEADGSSN